MKDIKLKRVSKDEWLNCALEALENSGVDGVRIDALARQLGVARSGFYWHFKDRQDLLAHMLEYWTQEYTKVVTENKDFAGGTPVQRLENVMRTIRDYDLGRFEAAIFVWSQSDPIARKALDVTHKQRMDFIGNIFSEIGFEGDELDMRVQLFVGYMAWEYSIFYAQSKTKQNRLLKLRLRLLTEK